MACNKGTLVNLSAVARLEEGRLLMSNGEYLPLSRRRAAEVKKAYFDYQIDDFRRGTLMPTAGRVAETLIYSLLNLLPYLILALYPFITRCVFRAGRRLRLLWR